MSEDKNNKLPQLIVDMITKMNDPRTPLFTRDLYRMHLQNVVDASSAAIVQYDFDRSKRKVARK